MPTLDIAVLPGAIDTGSVPVAVVVDVLRATTTIAAMLDAGSVGVRPVCRVDEALTIKAEEPGLLLAGERSGVAPAGFDLGNSPRPEAVAPVRGRGVVLSTTNGTAAAERAAAVGADVLTLSLTNLPAAVEDLIGRAKDTLVVCSGTDGERSLEDELAGGLLAEALLGAGWRLSERADAVRTEAMGLAVDGVEVPVRRSFHAQRLVDLGCDGDVAFCARVGVTRTIPVLDRGAGGGLGMFVSGYH